MNATYQDVIDALNERHDIPATLEHPGYVNVNLPGDSCLAIGDMNGPWGCDLNKPDGTIAPLWELPRDTSATAVAESIAASVREESETVTDEERQNGPR